MSAYALKLPKPQRRHEKENHHALHQARPHRPRRFADRTRLHDLRRAWTGHPVWSLGEEESRPLIKHAVEVGINFFDTANMYSQGSSEEILGRALKDFARRDEVVIATKVRHPMHTGPNGAGLSRKAIFAEIDNSLRRLGTDYVDLYQIHRMDKATPIEE